MAKNPSFKARTSMIIFVKLFETLKVYKTLSKLAQRET